MLFPPFVFVGVSEFNLMYFRLVFRTSCSSSVLSIRQIRNSSIDIDIDVGDELGTNPLNLNASNFLFEETSAVAVAVAVASALTADLEIEGGEEEAPGIGDDDIERGGAARRGAILLSTCPCLCSAGHVGYSRFWIETSCSSSSEP